jgi:hypothetical protein
MTPPPYLVLPDVGAWQGRCFRHRLCQPFSTVVRVQMVVRSELLPSTKRAINQRVCAEYTLLARACQAFIPEVRTIACREGERQA